jgi:Mg2+-importing ATPase
MFDFLTFGLLLLVLHATQIEFRTGWFLESVISASLIVLVIRSRKPFFRSQPGKYLLIATLSIFIVTMILPYTPVASIFGFSPLPVTFLLSIGFIVLIYIFTAEIVKKIFYKRVKF